MKSLGEMSSSVYTIMACSLPMIVIYYRSSIQRNAAQVLTLLGEDSVEEIESVKCFNHIIVPLSSIDEFTHQVAGHTKEILRVFKGCILKPMIKVKHFFRELRIYEEMESHGTHWTQSAKAFVSKYNGLIVAKAASTYTSSAQSSTSSSTSSSTKPPSDIASTIKNADRLFLALDDLTKGYKTPCAIDIKMGTQTYEPSATAEKKAREGMKCRHQAEIGFRITGFKVYDSLHGTYAGVGKEFGRSLSPDKVTDGLALFFFDGLQLRRDCIAAAIQKLERLLLWMKSQRKLHFYCSSILIVYDGEQHRPLGEHDAIVNYSNAAARNPVCSPSPDDEGMRHFLFTIPRTFPPISSSTSLLRRRESANVALRRRESEETSGLFNARFKANSNSPRNKLFRSTFYSNIDDQTSPLVEKCGESDHNGSSASAGSDSSSILEPFTHDQLAEKKALRLARQERETSTQLKLKQIRESRLSTPVADLVRVALIDFAHALPGTGGVDEGYVHGLKGLISRLRCIVQSADSCDPRPHWGNNN